MKTPDPMKDNITETAVIAMMPWVASMAGMAAWLTAFVALPSGIWIGLQIILRLKRAVRESRERRAKKSRKP